VAGAVLARGAPVRTEYAALGAGPLWERSEGGTTVYGKDWLGSVARLVDSDGVDQGWVIGLGDADGDGAPDDPEHAPRLIEPNPRDGGVYRVIEFFVVAPEDASGFYDLEVTCKDASGDGVDGYTMTEVDDPLNRDLVQAVEFEVEIAGNSGFDGIPGNDDDFTDDELLGLRHIEVWTENLNTGNDRYKDLLGADDPNKLEKQPWKGYGQFDEQGEAVPSDAPPPPEGDPEPTRGALLPEVLNVLKMEYVIPGETYNAGQDPNA
jgi:hypothetical protein